MKKSNKHYMLLKKLKTYGPYELKFTSIVGYWVDGKCGYYVVGYFNDSIECLDLAIQKIQQSINDNFWPAWRFE